MWSLTLGEIPREIFKKLNLPKADEGIDLIAETHEGEFWSIQCKYVSKDRGGLTRKKLITFTDLSFSICNDVTFGLICSSADKVSSKMELYGDKLGFCAGENFRVLNKDFFDQIRNETQKKKVKFIPYSPRKHQVRAISNALDHFLVKKATRGKMIMPCGAGKSLTAFWIAEKLKPKSILIAVPSLSLVGQTLEVWARESVAKKMDIRWICVCSDQSVKDKTYDDPSISKNDIGIDVKTNCSEISKWLTKETGLTNVIFTTYQSGPTITSALKQCGLSVDFGIFDEAHKTVGSKNKLFAHLLDDSNIRIKRRLFMTATERRYLGNSEEILSMDDAKIYGKTFDLLTFKEALQTKPPILCDYKIITMTVTTQEIKKFLQANVLVRPTKGKILPEQEAKILGAALMLRNAIEQNPLKHIISFHSSISRASAFKETQENINQKFPEYTHLECFHVTGAMATSSRQRIMEDAVKSETSLITNARCLTEGVDIKEIDGVLFTDPKKSTVDIVQAVGRALRPHPDKKWGYILIPIVLDSKKLRERIDQNDAYQDLLMILRALASNDERIIEYFKNRSEKNGGGHGGGGGITIDCPKTVDVDPEDFANELHLKIWSKLAKLSWRPFEEARSFVHKIGLESKAQWSDYCNGKFQGLVKPLDIPSQPREVYLKSGWDGWGNWLGTYRVADQDRDFLPFEKAREFARALKLSTAEDWKDYCKNGKKGCPSKPEDIPNHPSQTYKNKGWKGMPDWLGSSSFRKGQALDYTKAVKFVHTLELKSAKEWRRYCNGEILNLPPKPSDIPTHPDRVYRKTGDWKDWGSWLGTGKIAARNKKFLDFKKARKFSQSLGLKTWKEWVRYCRGDLTNKPKKPENIPSNPDKSYKGKGWVSWPDWLGTK